MRKYHQFRSIRELRKNLCKSLLRRRLVAVFAVLIGLSGYPVHADISVPSDSSDGAFSPTENIEIDLSQAVTGQWDANNAANAGAGIYDASKWAVVFKFSEVNIPSGVTVTFKNHGSRAPVVWLVSGEVSIDGELRLDGKRGDDLAEGEPGPGGFRGGNRSFGAPSAGHGFGPGGGNGFPSLSKAGGGSYGTGGRGAAGPKYGNAALLPLIGGSGATAPGSGSTSTGGAGGGAILIAAAQSMRIDGLISATSEAGSGSGGGIRLVAESMSGVGVLDVRGSSNNSFVSGGLGRIRFEAVDFSAAWQTYGVGGFAELTEAPEIWPPADTPTARVISVNGVAAPADPRAVLAPPNPDTTIEASAAVPVVIETTNLPIDSSVKVRIVPRYGNSFTRTATHQSGNEALSTWTASVDFPLGYAAIQVTAIGP